MLPTVDVGPLVERGSAPARAAAAESLRNAWHEVGFCYIENHQVPAGLERDLLMISERFFALESAEKRSLAIENSPHFRGYTALGHELTGGQPDWREQLDLGPEERVETNRTGPLWCRLRGPNQWPASLPELRGLVLPWMDAMSTLASDLLCALAAALGQPAHFFDEFYRPRGDPHVKIMRYPPRTSGSNQGVGLHHDSGLLSFLLQGDVPGLNVLIGDKLVEAKPKPGTYLVNLGEMLELATGGYLRATKHEVVSPRGDRARISLAYFAHPRLESTFRPIALPPALRANESTRLAEGTATGAFGEPVFSTFGDNYLKIRLRAHPEAARIHYADYAS